MNGWAAAGNSHDLNDSGPTHASWTTSWPSITFAVDASASSSTVNDEKAFHAASRFLASRHEMAQDPSAESTSGLPQTGLRSTPALDEETPFKRMMASFDAAARMIGLDEQHYNVPNLDKTAGAAATAGRTISKHLL